jgi:hypothetical protein
MRVVLSEKCLLKKLAVKGLIGTVWHSYTNDLAKCWIICENRGSIISAHCDCVAGKGKVCSHVAAILFVVNEEQKSFEVSKINFLVFRMKIYIFSVRNDQSQI